MTKRFTYEYDEYNGNLFDNKMNTFYHIEDSDENIEVLCDRLNWLVEENEQLKEVLGSILIEVRRDVSATNHCGEVKAFVTPNSFDLIVDVLKKYGALKGWYE